MSLLDLLILSAFLVVVALAKVAVSPLSLLALVCALIVGRILKGERSL